MIQSTERMREAFDRYVQKGLITRDALDYARRNGYAPHTIAKLEAALLSRARQSRESLMRIAAPAAQQALPAPDRDGPTPEWLAKAGRRATLVSTTRGGARTTYKLRTPLEQYGDRLQLTRRTALERFLADSDYARRIRTANLQPSGGGKGDGSRVGGIGDVWDYARVGFGRYEWVYRHLGEEAREVARMLITQEVKRSDGAPMTFEEAGQRLGPDIGHKHRLWGTSFGGLKVLAGQIVRLYELCPIGFRAVDDTEREFIAAMDAAQQED